MACETKATVSCQNRVRFLETILTDGGVKKSHSIRKMVGKEVKAEVKAGHITLGVKTEVVFKTTNVEACVPAFDCGDRGCCP